MGTRLIDEELLRRKRDLRLRIGRSRRRVAARLQGTRHEARKLISWRTYVIRYPVWALTAALGLGMAASTGFSRGRAPRWIGLWLTRRAIGGAQQQVWSELSRIWGGVTTDKQSRDE